MNSKTAILLIPLLGIIGCAIAQPVQKLAPGAENVVVAKSAPGENYKMIGPVSGSDGTASCGLWGYTGSYDRATTSLRNKTHEMGGDYAEIITMIEPHWIGQCFANEYVINATAYKKVRDRPSPAPGAESGEEKLTKELRELKRLLDDGILSKEEYEQQKSKLLEKGFEQ